ncbi:alpha/beta hydrolase [Dactylosporangium sp. CA-139114]|uniref:alpha/beta hydrolase n=1 Tax=Dactylosporangium sp. CA-139114 TaxID=3239931 RepID=UPI003D95B507
MTSAPTDSRTGAVPPFDPELDQPVRDILAGLPSMTADTIAERRVRSADGRMTDEQIRRGGAFSLEERTFPGPGGDLAVLICRPTAMPGPHGVIVNIHGGGMVAGHNRTLELHGELVRAERLGLAVVAVEYRLAPEHPDPAPVEDCYAGLVWTAGNAAGLGLDPARIVVSGNSAGGGLAAGVALMARDRGGPRLLGQMLQCPMLDDRCDSPSGRQMVGVGLWDRTSNVTGWTALLGDRRGTPRVSYYAAPARAEDLSGLPPMFVDVGSVEALRDESVAFVSRVWQQGGDAELHVWAGAFHSFDQWVPDAVVSGAAQDARIAWLRRILARSTG